MQAEPDGPPSPMVPIGHHRGVPERVRYYAGTPSTGVASVDQTMRMGTAEPYYDRKEQLSSVTGMLRPAEQVLAVFDMKGGDRGFVGITTKRLIIYDKSFLRKRKATVSVPFSRVQSVAAEDESGLFTGRGFFGSS